MQNGSGLRGGGIRHAKLAMILIPTGSAAGKDVSAHIVFLERKPIAMTTTIKQRVLVTELCTEKEVYGIVQRRVEACPYAFFFRRVICQFDAGRLMLRGCVPSFYLKQVLQELLRGIEHVNEIDNDVDVVCSTGLSSERPNQPR